MQMDLAKYVVCRKYDIKLNVITIIFLDKVAT